MSYPRIGFTTLITCLGIVLTPSVLLSATISLPEFSPSAHTDSSSETGVRSQESGVRSQKERRFGLFFPFIAGAAAPVGRFDETAITRQIANQVTESTEPVVPAPIPPFPLSQFCPNFPLLRSRVPSLITPLSPFFTRSGFSAKDSILSQIAMGYASIGQSDQSLQSVQTIQNESTKADTLMKMARLYLEAREPQLATPILSQALPIVQNLKVNQLTKAYTLVEIAELYLEAGELQLATSTLSQTLPIVQNLEANYQQTNLLTAIAVNLAEAGQLSQALQVANNQKSEARKVNILVKIAIKLAQIGQVSRALEIAQGLEESRELRVWSAIAQQYIKTGQHDQAIQLTQNVKDYCNQANILYEVVGYLLDAEQYDLALQHAQTIEYRPRKNTALLDIAIKLAEARQFDQALQVTQTIQYAPNQAKALTRIATQLVEAGEQTKASEVLSQALEILESVNSEQFLQPKPLPLHNLTQPIPIPNSQITNNK